jgi:hypothetical protein
LQQVNKQKSLANVKKMFTINISSQSILKIKKKIFGALLSATLLFGVVAVRSNVSTQVGSHVGYCLAKGAGGGDFAKGAGTGAGCVAGVWAACKLGATVGSVGGVAGRCAGALIGAA